MSQPVQQVVGGQMVQVQGQVVSGTQVVNSAGQVVMSTAGGLTSLGGQQLVTQLVPSQGMQGQVVHQAATPLGVATTLASAISQGQVVGTKPFMQHTGITLVFTSHIFRLFGENNLCNIISTAVIIMNVVSGQTVQQVVSGQHIQTMASAQQTQQVVAAQPNMITVPAATATAQVKPPPTPNQPVPAPPSSTNASADTTAAVLNKQRITELVREVDPTEQLEEEVEEMLLSIADDFIESTVNAACRLAKHRGARSLDVKDVQMYLERNWHMWLPGFGTDELRPYKRAPTTEAHRQRLALIRKAIKKY
ncbi:Transcription initiation factor TFIID subunit 12 [Chionoecetes opilio]|uniref:Transcription initiation factor TFIID subunit 12 n=1 Tax=Chionoecetes opilio TaxID=41210 RepID=A0A8J5D2T3_CHIOP|nr:Transcription initiation factor TFIID subunit 12 [Chionoecetes opilio]